MNQPCICGHDVSQHIYHEGACRPGFECVDQCEEFVEAMCGQCGQFLPHGHAYCVVTLKRKLDEAQKDLSPYKGSHDSSGTTRVEPEGEWQGGSSRKDDFAAKHAAARALQKAHYRDSNNDVIRHIHADTQPCPGCQEVGAEAMKDGIVEAINEVAEFNPLSRGTCEVLLKRLERWPGWKG